MHTPPNANAFTRMLTRHAPYVEKRQHVFETAKGKEWCYAGIILRSGGTPPGGKRSQHSQDSQHFPYPISAREIETSAMWWVEQGEETDSAVNKGKQKPVNVVNPVKTDTVGATPKRTYPTRSTNCPKCGKNQWRTVGDGYRCVCGQWWEEQTPQPSPALPASPALAMDDFEPQATACPECGSLFAKWHGNELRCQFDHLLMVNAM
jgi:hypothetical protein